MKNSIKKSFNWYYWDMNKLAICKPCFPICRYYIKIILSTLKYKNEKYEKTNIINLYNSIMLNMTRQ